MTRHVWLTRRCRPPFFITTSRFTLPVGVGGVSTENQKNRIKTEANALRKVYAIFRLDSFFHSHFKFQPAFFQFGHFFFNGCMQRVQLDDFIAG